MQYLINDTFDNVCGTDGLPSLKKTAPLYTDTVHEKCKLTDQLESPTQINKKQYLVLILLYTVPLPNMKVNAEKIKINLSFIFFIHQTKKRVCRVFLN